MVLFVSWLFEAGVSQDSGMSGFLGRSESKGTSRERGGRPLRISVIFTLSGGTWRRRVAWRYMSIE